MKLPKIFLGCLVLALSNSSPLARAADSYPSKPVRWIVPAPAGGPSDYRVRRIAQRLSEAWRQPVVVENRAGAAGIIAAELVAKAAPDGYTLLHGHVGMFAINPALYQNLPYDPLKDFIPVTRVTSGPAIVLVNPQVPAKTLAELIALAKRKPGELSYGSAGSGSPQHITGEMFKQLTGVDLVHIPYKGSAPLITDLVGGQIQVGFDYAVPAGEQVKAGKLRALAVAGPKRLPYLPDVPTTAEAGLPEFQSIVWNGLFVAAGTPPNIVQTIHDQVVKIINTPEEQSEAARLGYDLRGSTSDEFREFIKAEMIKWGKVVKASGAKVD
jgi:tripartite-type tricarboxylate transporter receptor subunit TctC